MIPSAAAAPLARGSAAVRLSVVIPTRNRCAMTLRAVDSVLGQAGAEAFELIVVIDGSTDATEATLRARHRDDARVRLIVTPRRGVSAARNAGFHAGCGAVVCFLDSDDWWVAGAWTVADAVLQQHPDLAFVSLEQTALPVGAPPIPRYLRATGPGWSHAGFAAAPLREARIATGVAAQAATMLCGDFFPAIVNGFMFQQDTLFIRRDAALRAGLFHEDWSYLEDWHFHARLCLVGHGAHLDVEGCRRDIGRPDELSFRKGRANSHVHLAVLRMLQRRHGDAIARYGDCVAKALLDAQYRMGARLARGRHRRWAYRYLRRCVLGRHKIAKALVHLARSWQP